MVKTLVPLAGAFLLVLNVAARADELRGPMDSVDPTAHTFTIGGETVHAPADMDISFLESGSNYDVTYTTEDGRNVLQELSDEWGHAHHVDAEHDRHGSR